MSTHRTRASAQPNPFSIGVSALLFVFLLGSGCKVMGQGAPKADHAHQVFERLIMARGDGRTPEPTFVFSPLKAHAASASDGTITLEETAYDVCAAFGENADHALAGILAHELIHYYEGHEWEDGFITVVGEQDDEAGMTGTVAENAAAFTKDEIEADYLGGFLAHLAGYQSTRLMPEVLDGIYAAYELPEELTNYPRLRQRKAIATKTADMLDELIDVFEVGNLLTALGRYEEGLAYYEYLLKRFQSREMYNNLGSIYALAALDHFDRARLPTIYAFQLDFDSRMTTGTRSVTQDRTLREALLREAIGAFERAADLDEAYPSGQLNLASAHSLLAHSLRQAPAAADADEEAEDHLLTAKLALRQAAKTPGALSDTVVMSRIKVLQSTVATQLTATDTVARQVVAEPTVGPAPASGFMIRESIGGNTVDDLLLNSVDWASTTAISSDPVPTELRTTPATGKGEAGISKLLHEFGRSGVLFLRASDSAAGATSLDVAVGSPKSDVTLEYGEPSRRVALAGGGELLVYEASELVFLLRDGIVTTWYLYREV